MTTIFPVPHALPTTFLLPCKEVQSLTSPLELIQAFVTALTNRMKPSWLLWVGWKYNSASGALD